MSFQRIHDGRGVFPLLLATGILLGAGFAGGCDSSSGGSGGGDVSLAGTVAGATGTPLVAATVILVPASAVSTAEITAAGILAGTTEGFDEPLEDAVAGAAPGAFVTATTGADGTYTIEEVPDGDFFVYVEPAAGDTEHLPGGSLCRTAVSGAALRGTTQDIVMSSSPPAAATYVGMTACLICHNEYTTELSLAHRLGFKVPGATSGLQDTSEHPEVDDGLAYFLEAADYSEGTPVYHYDYDGTRSFDKFKTSLTDPSDRDGTVYAILWLWKDAATDEYKITFDNVGNPTDPNDLSTRTVQLTYGGAVHKQRYMIDWAGRNGLYPILQFQSEGDEARYDRTRQVYRDYNLAYYWNTNGTASDPSDDLIATPSITRNISRNCVGCHAPDYSRYTDAVTGELLCDTQEDVNGEYDIDGDGFLNDLNIGCESCHGPGSDHVVDGTGRYIVSPNYLAPGRAVQICNSCHDRPLGADATGGETPLSADEEFPRPGISRAQFLAEYTSRKGPAESDFWTDFAHSKSHHQQSSDFLKSSHYRNANQLVVCSDCHDMHGGTGHERALVADPDEPDSPLCMICHGDDIGGTLAHTTAVLGSGHGPFTASCVDCHMVQTAKTGAGRYGYLLEPPTGTSADVNTAYYENDISSHIFDVPSKDNVGVQGIAPSNAMPIPYTNDCGACHDPSGLQYD
ncbi:MAG: hypothetical protein AB1726_01535 [Planctomycetota bacterium]